MPCETCQTQLNSDSENSESEPAAQDCPDCGQPSSANCPDGLNSLNQQTDFHCPICTESPLFVGTIHKTQVCFCNGCRGFVIDRGSLGDLVETLRTAYDGPDDKPEMIDHDELKKLCMCPACNELMETFNYCGPGNVVLDTCEGCKLTWLDQGELAMIVRAPGKRDYGAGRNQESELLRSQLYANANADSTAGAFLLGRLFM